MAHIPRSAILVLALTLLASCGYEAQPIEDSRILPLPDGLELLASDEGGCGNGRDAICDRTFVVSATNGAALAELLAAVQQHLSSLNRWEESPSPSKWCLNSGLLCADIEDIEGDGWAASSGSRLLEEQGTRPTGPAVAVLFTDSSDE